MNEKIKFLYEDNRNIRKMVQKFVKSKQSKIKMDLHILGLIFHFGLIIEYPL